jgi:hypothetical protein
MQRKIPLLDTDNKIKTSDLGSGTPTGTKFLRDDKNWVTPPSGGIITEFEFDSNGDIQPTEFSGTFINTYDLSPADTIIPDEFFEADVNGDLQPVA